jgi:uncharacterized membrane protein
VLCRFDKDKIIVRLLDHRRSEFSGTNLIHRSVQRVVTHSRYNDRTFDNDIALLRFDEAVPFEGPLRPVCLPVTGMSSVSTGNTVSARTAYALICAFVSFFSACQHLSQYHVDGMIIYQWRFVKDLEGSYLNLIKVLSWYIPRGSGKKNHDNANREYMSHLTFELGTWWICTATVGCLFTPVSILGTISGKKHWTSS